MQRTLRGVLRFSCGGFTYLRIASRLDVSAPSEISAHTGRRTSLRGLFCVPAMCLPNKIVYDIPSPPADSQFACRVNDNPPCLANWWPFALASYELSSQVFPGRFSCSFRMGSKFFRSSVISLFRYSFRTFSLTFFYFVVD